MIIRQQRQDAGRLFEMGTVGRVVTEGTGGRQRERELRERAG